MNTETLSIDDPSVSARRLAYLIRPERQRINTDHRRCHSNLRIIERDYGSEKFIMEVSDPLEAPQSKSISLWNVYCYILTWYLSPFVLRYCFGT
jgi:hypothetical protein